LVVTLVYGIKSASPEVARYISPDNAPEIEASVPTALIISLDKSPEIESSRFISLYNVPDNVVKLVSTYSLLAASVSFVGSARLIIVPGFSNSIDAGWNLISPCPFPSLVTTAISPSYSNTRTAPVVSSDETASIVVSPPCITLSTLLLS